ncbi:inositol monophosphatase family protein [Enterovirga aerilata]|uniref:3'(2'),5'-bisphosphate nucleotidase CysQ n=1 Tax=Enterovirga aerilata TaxID=2730920 RepID=A0A849HZK9_9HYPH|nr:3'(2'),5'-bisphosphate nucleotidase CysQ [Enterovirga sp. DB1703]NNM72966.1 3'(2'),5'-bisphosphate nucleotidase CysQ [Enterovirga sp. DB1703]
MTRSAPDPHDLMPELREIAREAGGIAMRFFRSGLSTSARIWSKAGGSPVTEADVAVDTFLKVRLSGLLPEAGWLSEETADDPRRLDRRHVWIVDPIDGTRAYLSGSHDWSVAIALLEENRPVLGFVYAPAHETVFEAEAGRGAFRNRERIAVSRATSLEGISVAGPKPFVDRLERRVPSIKRPPRIPSLALRISRVAEGSVDAGLVSTDARDWDIAAADLILHEAGGALTTLAGAVPRYNQPEPSHGELAAAPQRLHQDLLAAITGR